MNCGLLGRTLGHSYSPQIHALLGDYTYSLFEKEPEQLESFLKQGEFSGLNVTMPYKQAVIPHLDELSPIAQKLDAVNTIVRRNGRLVGHNTDFFGFSSMLAESGLDPREKKCLVLGSGGASRTVCAVLEELGAAVVVISRKGENHYGNLSIHRDAAIIVNTTPVGMYPDTLISPVDLSLFPQLEGVLDVIYNPARTQLLLEAEKRSLVTMNGLWMLVAQAWESAQWFTGHAIPREKIRQIYGQLKLQMENIILIGMPGSGKTTIGQMLAQQAGKTFADTDELICRLAGKSIPEIFAEDGESVFRDWETQAIAQLGKCSNLVIATGGGCVTRSRNYPLLHQNGTLIWLRRDLCMLPTEGRPLSQSTKPEQMYAIRKPMYETFADRTVDNFGDPKDTVCAIMKYLKE